MDRLDVVAVRIPDERTVVVVVVLRPQPRFVQRLGTQRQGGVEERLHRLRALGREGDVDLPVRALGLPGGGVGDPETGVVGAVTDGLTHIQLPSGVQNAEHLVVEVLGLLPIRTVDSEMVDHVATVHSRRRPYDRAR